MKIQVYRANASSYQDANFIQYEKKVIEKIPGIIYITSLTEINSEIPFILITNTHTKTEDIPHEILSKTMLMIHPNSGHDNISKEFIDQSPFPIIMGNPIRSHAVSEYVLSCIFKEIAPIDNHTHWSSHRLWPRKLLRDQKVLILGHGHIGKLLRDSLSAITNQVISFDPFVHDKDVENEWDDKYLDDTDILIVAASLTQTSKKMLSKEQLERLPLSNLIINAARGEIICEKDLMVYLKNNPQSKCYLDVFETEPFPPGYYNDINNLNKTSHIAGVHERLNQDIVSFEYLVINDFVESLHNFSQDFTKEYQGCLLNPGNETQQL